MAHVLSTQITNNFKSLSLLECYSDRPRVFKGFQLNE